MSDWLFVGRGTAGSWAIRGHQLGRAVGARVAPNAVRCEPGQGAVLVKRPQPRQVEHLRGDGGFLVWDVVDGWPQPLGNGGNLWTRDQAMNWLRDQVDEIQPDAIVAATKPMALDCAEFRVPVLHLPHHARPEQRRNSVRERVQVVGYEGAEAYIQQWRPVIEKLCTKRGWKFVVNPTSLADVDILLALRDQDGYPARAWKSGVKLANAQGTGTPIICKREHGYLETASGGEHWADTPDELDEAFDALTPHAARQAASRKLLTRDVSLESTAKVYAAWLRSLLKS